MKAAKGFGACEKNHQLGNFTLAELPQGFDHAIGMRCRARIDIFENPLQLIRGALTADTTAFNELNGPPEGIVYSSGDPELTGPVDLRSADEETLTLLPGIGPVLARRITEWRDAREEPWQVDDLLEVSGIGPARLELLKPLVTTGRPGPESGGK